MSETAVIRNARRAHAISTLLTLIHSGLYTRALVVTCVVREYDDVLDLIFEALRSDRVNQREWMQIKNQRKLQYKNKGIVIVVPVEHVTRVAEGTTWDIILPLDPDVVFDHMVTSRLTRGLNPLMLGHHRVI